MWRITSCLLNFHTEVTPVTSWILLAKQATWSYLISKKQQVHPTICLGSRHPEYWLLSTDDCHRNHCHQTTVEATKMNEIFYSQEGKNYKMYFNSITPRLLFPKTLLVAYAKDVLNQTHYPPYTVNSFCWDLHSG